MTDKARSMRYLIRETLNAAHKALNASNSTDPRIKDHIESLCNGDIPIYTADFGDDPETTKIYKYAGIAIDSERSSGINVILYRLNKYKHGHGVSIGWEDVEPETEEQINVFKAILSNHFNLRSSNAPVISFTDSPFMLLTLKNINILTGWLALLFEYINPLPVDIAEYANTPDMTISDNNLYAYITAAYEYLNFWAAKLGTSIGRVEIDCNIPGQKASVMIIPKYNTHMSKIKVGQNVTEYNLMVSLDGVGQHSRRWKEDSVSYITLEIIIDEGNDMFDMVDDEDI